MKSYTLDKKVFYKKLAPLMFPIAFQNLMQSLVSASDTLMLGLVDQNSIAAASLATQVTFVCGLFYWGFIGGGTTVLTAQYWGKGSRKDVEEVFAVSFRPLVLISSVFTLAALLIPELLMRIFTPERQLITLGARYLRYVSVSYVLGGISQCYLCVMKNCGRAPRASLISSVGVVFNIGLNAILIFGLLGAPEMGIAGAALATTITRLLELVWVIAESFRPGAIRLPVKLLSDFRLSLEKPFWKYTLPVLGTYLAWGGGIAVGPAILGHLGGDAVAANSIASVVKNLVACFCMGLSNGGGILVGNELGAGRLEQAKAYGEKVVNLALISGVVSGVLLVAVTPVVRSFAELTPAASSYLSWMILVCAINLVSMSHNSATNSGIFVAGGDTKFAFICDTITLWGIIVPLGLLGAFVWKLPVLAVYFILNMDEWVKFAAVRKHFRKYNWVRDLTRQQ